jgi:hypothetical protein
MNNKKISFQVDRPVFVRIPFTSSGRHYEVEEEYKWKEVAGISQEKAQQLYNVGYLIHRDDIEVKAEVGDGLTGMAIEELHSLVATINSKVKSKTKSENEFNKYKVKKSTLASKQIGILRSWRRNHGHLEN